MRGKRFIMRGGNNLVPLTPVENIKKCMHVKNMEDILIKIWDYGAIYWDCRASN